MLPQPTARTRQDGRILSRGMSDHHSERSRVGMYIGRTMPKDVTWTSTVSISTGYVRMSLRSICNFRTITCVDAAETFKTPCQNWMGFILPSPGRWVSALAADVTVKKGHGNRRVTEIAQKHAQHGVLHGPIDSKVLGGDNSEHSLFKRATPPEVERREVHPSQSGRSGRRAASAALTTQVGTAPTDNRIHTEQLSSTKSNLEVGKRSTLTLAPTAHADVHKDGRNSVIIGVVRRHTSNFGGVAQTHAQTVHAIGGVRQPTSRETPLSAHVTLRPGIMQWPRELRSATGPCMSNWPRRHLITLTIAESRPKHQAAHVARDHGTGFSVVEHARVATA